MLFLGHQLPVATYHDEHPSCLKADHLDRNYSYGWHMQYLTIIGLSLSTATFAVGLLADLTLSHRLFQIKNTLSVASAPMECLISLLYWGLRAVRLEKLRMILTCFGSDRSPPDRPQVGPP